MPKYLTRARTGDRGPPGAARVQHHVVGQIGPKRKLLPNGSLLCEDVPIARTGTMRYQVGEVPVRPPSLPGAAPVLFVTRDAETLFSPEAMGSALGCPVTFDHPPVDVTPDNWSQLAKGHLQDVWRGEGAESDLLFADIVIHDRGLIHKVQSGEIKEVSPGYTADYETVSDGEGRQKNIVVNHLALVERGRCGPRCSIGDHDPTFINEEDTHMPQANAGGPRKRVRLSEARSAATQALQDLAAAEALQDEGDEDGIHVHVHTGATRDGATAGEDDEPPRAVTLDAAVEARFAAIEEGMVETHGLLRQLVERIPAAAETPPVVKANTGDGDSAAMQTGFQQFVSQAEILVPGFRAPTFDSALPRAKTVDTMCASRRQVLGMVAATKDGAALLASVTDEPLDVDKAPCDQVAIAFKAAATLKSAHNNRAATGDSLRVPAVVDTSLVSPGPAPVRTDKEINEANAKFWANQ